MPVLVVSVGLTPCFATVVELEPYYAAEVEPKFCSTIDSMHHPVACSDLGFSSDNCCCAAAFCSLLLTIKS